MPSLEKSPPALVARFDEVVSRHPSAERRKMFGYPALFVGGNLASGLFADRWMVRLAPADLATLLALPGASPFSPMAGRVMRGYGLLPPDLVDDDTGLDDWLERAFAMAATLPAKR
ncbi:MAG: TfoX/Sxy family protein [Candidatus Limnocylindrales bacterium]